MPSTASGTAGRKVLRFGTAAVGAPGAMARDTPAVPTGSSLLISLVFDSATGRRASSDAVALSEVALSEVTLSSVLTVPVATALVAADAEGRATGVATGAASAVVRSADATTATGVAPS